MTVGLWDGKTFNGKKIGREEAKKMGNQRLTAALKLSAFSYQLT